MSPLYDLAIVGASFSGLACARAAAGRGLTTLVIDRKPLAGHRMHTTGLLVKEVADKLNVPSHLTRQIKGVRLYSPNLRHVDLEAPGYYFLATEIQGLMAWLAGEAQSAGSELRFGAAYRGASRKGEHLQLHKLGCSARFLCGADGPSSAVARDFKLSVNTEFLIGVEAEYEGVGNVDPDRLHCFLDSRLAPGYIGWVIPGVNITQIGLACRLPNKPRLKAFVQKIAALFDMARAKVLNHRGGLIPVGGRVAKWHGGDGRVLLTGDAAGIVSPLTAGGIHTAIDSGWYAAHAIADFLDGGPPPYSALEQHYPRFRLKRWMRRALDLNPPNALYNLMLGNPLFRSIAAEIYFHRRARKSLTP